MFENIIIWIGIIIMSIVGFMIFAGLFVLYGWLAALILIGGGVAMRESLIIILGIVIGIIWLIVYGVVTNN